MAYALSTRLIACVVFLCVCLSVSSCREKIEVSLATGEPRLTVEGWLFDGYAPCVIKLGLTTDFYTKAENRLGPVEILLNDGTRDYAFERREGNLFVTTDSVDASPGKTFTLRIRYDGERYEAVSTMPSFFPITTIETEFIKTDLFNDGGYYVRLGVNEIPGERNFARWVVYENGVKRGGASNLLLGDDAWIDGSYIDFLIAGPYEVGDTVRVEQWSIEEAAFRYLTEVQNLFFSSGSPFAATPVNPPTNVRNIDNRERNALGYFGAVAVDSRTIVISE